MPRGIRSDDKPDVTVRNVKVKRESEKAILIITPDGEEIWVPKSQLRDGGTAKKDGPPGTVVISAWIAGEKGLTDSEADDDDTGSSDD